MSEAKVTAAAEPAAPANPIKLLPTNSNNLPLKTPISFLQEFCARMGITPKYDLLSIEGAVHEPTFVYRVTVGDINANGTGQSKKKAKHCAAKAVLDILLASHGGANMFTKTGPEEREEQPIASAEITTTQMLSPYDDGIPGNPVGQLQEFCMARRWPPPSYKVITEEGLPHERTFTLACIVKKYEEKGIGKSKKLSKRQAANKMLQLLNDTPVKQENVNVFDEDDEEQYQGLKDNRIPTITPSLGHKISHFYRNIKSAPGEHLNKLHTTKLCEENAFILLQNIAIEHNFEVTYVDIEEKSKSSKFQCLVQLSTMPVAVLPGSGATSQEAQENAAYNALEYLRIMTR